MVNEERILDILTSMQSDVSELKSDVSTLKTDVSGLKTDVSGLKTDVAALQSDMATVKNDILKINIKLETDIEVKIDALGEGHAAILESLVPRTRVDELESELRFLKTVVFRMSEDIQELKQAQ